MQLHATSLVLALLLTGCAGSFEVARHPSLKLGAPPPSARCAALLSMDDVTIGGDHVHYPSAMQLTHGERVFAAFLDALTYP